MRSKNAMAAFITYCIGLVIAYFVWGHTPDHIWSAWLFLALVLIGTIIFISILINRLRAVVFDGTLAFCVVGIVAFGLILFNDVSYIDLQFLNIFDYIFSGFLAVLLIFTIVRYLQNQSS